LLFARQGAACSTNGVDPVVLGSAAAPAAADLDHVLTGFGEDHGQAGREAAGALQGPDPTTGRVPVGPGQQPGVTIGIGSIRAAGADRSSSGLDDGQVDGVPVRVASDDVFVLLCQHDHCGCLLISAIAVGTGLGRGHCRGSTVKGHVGRRTSS